MNRSERRDVLRTLHRHGCRCTPRLSPEVPVAVGGTIFDVTHRPGCPLGDAVAQLNRMGRYPLFIPSAPPRCWR